MRTGLEQACRNLLSQLGSTPREHTADKTPGQRQPGQRPLGHQPPGHQPPTIQDFLLTSNETKAVQEMTKLSAEYMLHKVANSTNSKVLLDFHTYFSLYNNLPSPECSNIVYFKVLDQRCDNKETLVNLISDIYEEFVLSKRKKWVLLEGDQFYWLKFQTHSSLSDGNMGITLQAFPDSLSVTKSSP